MSWEAFKRPMFAPNKACQLDLLQLNIIATTPMSVIRGPVKEPRDLNDGVNTKDAWAWTSGFLSLCHVPGSQGVSCRLGRGTLCTLYTLYTLCRKGNR